MASMVRAGVEAEQGTSGFAPMAGVVTPQQPAPIQSLIWKTLREARRFRAGLFHLSPPAREWFNDTRGRENRVERTHLYRKLKQLNVEIGRERKG